MLTYNLNGVSNSPTTSGSRVVMILLILISLVMIFSYGAGHAAAADGSIIYVNSSSGSDVNNGYTWNTAKLTIKNATGTVSNGGTVNIASGTYTGTGNKNISINKNLTLIGIDENNTIIDAQGTSNIFNIQSGIKITILNLTLQNGNTDNGGAIKNLGILNLNNITFQDNTANRGGAIYNDDGTLTIYNCTFTRNTATERGGAICSDNTATLTCNTFTLNSAPNGGAIFHDVRALTGIGNSFVLNTANYGGAIFNNGGTITQNDSEFIQNTATNHGGGIYNGKGILTEFNNTYALNTALSGNGGAIFNTGNVTDTFITYYNNSASVLGGGIYNNGGNVTGSNNTFTLNAAYWGGAIYNIASIVTENECVFIQNRATWGGGAIYNDGFLGTPRVNIANNTFNNNTSIYGGVIYNINATSIGINNTFTDNNATNGGAQYNDVKSIIFTSNSTFIYNTAINGGANYNKGNVLNETNNSFIHNSAEYGGAIYNNNCSLTENSNLFSDNSARLTGGAVYNSNSTLTELNNTYSANTAISGNAGAIYNAGIVNELFTTFYSNTATNGNGGAIYNTKSSNLNGTKNTLTKNSANWGGAIYSLGTINGNNCTFNQNNATISGGAIYNDANSVLNETSTSFENNTVTAGNGGAIYNKGLANITFNRIIGNNNYDIYNYFQGSTLNARYNWWGTNFSGINPISAGRINSGTVDIWMVLTINAVPTQIPTYGTSNITDDLLHDSNGNYHNPSSGHVPDGIISIFNTTLGIINSPSYTFNGNANSTLQGGSLPGVADVSGRVDNQTVHTSVTINFYPSPTVISTNPAQYAVNLPANQVFTVTFSEPIIAANFNLIVLKTSTGTIITTTKIINGNILTITPNNPLTEAKYLLLLYAGCVKDSEGNPSVAASRTYGIGAQPYVTSTDPTNYAVNIPRNKVITAIFNEPIVAKYLTLVQLKNATTGLIINTTKTVNGNTLTITPTTPLAANTRYLLLIYTFAVTDLAGNSNVNKAISFTTGAT
jgi:predicted outer membrane repeat protein